MSWEWNGIIGMGYIMSQQEILNISLNNYKLASSFCREEFSKGEYVLWLGMR